MFTFDFNCNRCNTTETFAIDETPLKINITILYPDAPRAAGWHFCVVTSRATTTTAAATTTATPGTEMIAMVCNLKLLSRWFSNHALLKTLGVSGY